MGLLKSLTGGDVLSAGSGLLGGIIGGISANHAAKKQYEYQRKLNEQSQEFSEKNATIAYERQRELTEDNPLLQLQGMRNAGLSTSFSQGSTVAGASNVDQGATPSPGTAPSVASLAEGFNQGAQAAASIADLAVKKTQIANVKADTTGKEIDNTYKAAKAMADIKETMARTKGYNFDNELKEMSNNIYLKFGERQAEASTAQAEADALIKGSAAFYSDALNEADLDKRRADILLALSQKDVNDQTKKNLEGELSLLDDKRAELRSRTFMNNAVGQDSLSHVAVNKTQADLNKSNKTGVDLDNYLKAATQADKLVISFEECSQAKLRTYAMKLQTMPLTISQALSRQAMESYEKIQKGHGTSEDYARVTAQIAKEAIQTANQEAKDWAKIAISTIPFTSSAQTSNGYGANISSMPQYQ